MDTTTPLAPSHFRITAASPGRQMPEMENYTIHSQLSNGKWASRQGAHGIHDVRAFLVAMGANEETVDKAAAELMSFGLTDVTL